MAMLSKAIILLLFPLCLLIAAEDNSEECITRELTHSYITVPEKASGWTGETTLDMYHCNGFDYHATHMFMDVYLQINLTNEQSYEIYQGENCSEVQQHYRDDQRLWGLVRRVKLLRSKQLNPFQKTFVGISTKRGYAVRIRVWKINYMRLGIFVGGIALFLMSHSLVRNAIFYYTSGCTIGVLASLLIVGFIVYRLTPKSWLGVPLVFSGWSISFYIIYIIWKNFASLVLQYQKFVAAYFATVIMVSFAICYRYGPPTDVRSHNLAQWALQLIALTLIYSSCQIPDIAIAVSAVLLLWSVLKDWLVYGASKSFSVCKAVWYFLFPQYQRLLTLEEYQQQGEEETRKALEELRLYCRSPKADVWKITSSVRDPKRLASFVDGTSDHVSEEESLLYDLESANVDDLDDLSDDSGEDEYVVAQRSRMNSSYEPSRRRYQARENVFPSYPRSADRNSNPRQRRVLAEHQDMDSEDDNENEFNYDWQTHSLPLKNSQRRVHRRRDLYDSGPVTNNSFHSLRYRGNSRTSNRSSPAAEADANSEVLLSLQSR